MAAIQTLFRDESSEHCSPGYVSKWMQPSSKLTFVAAILSSCLVLTGCSSLSISPTSENEGPGTSFNTSDGRTPAEGDIDQSTSIRTVPKTAFLETIVERRTDEFGEYAVTRMSYPSIDSVENKGVSPAVLTSALEFYTDFLSTEVLDSIALDNYANYEKWVNEVAPKYVAAEFFNEVVDGQKNGQDAGVVFNNYSTQASPSYNKNISPVLLRDGGARNFNKHIWGIKAEPLKNGLYISAIGSTTVLINDEEGAKWDAIAYGPGGEVLTQYGDGKPQAGQLNFQVGLTLTSDGDSWKIAGYSNSFSINNGEFFLEAPQKFIDWRSSIK
jgi:hypothetical protein